MKDDEDGFFNSLLLSHWKSLNEYLTGNDKIHLTKTNTSLAAVIAVTRYNIPAAIDSAVWTSVEESAEIVHGILQGRKVIYGINTGFGANADTRTAAGVAISRGLIRALHFGVLTGPASNQDARLLGDADSLSSLVHKRAVPLGHSTDSYMPESWVRAMMMIRAINLSKGVSGVRPHIIENLITLVNKKLTPVVPLRGSISASGDLSPLSYVGGLLQGKPVLKVMTYPAEDEPITFVTADQALRIADIAPIDIGPKEGLAIVNGTAASAGVASLAIHEMLSFCLLAQVLTVGTVEATSGSAEGFSSFLSDIRPHKGQTECAANMLAFLSNSKLSLDFDDASDGLRQERYSTRTSPQWIGPVLEDVMLACEQVTIEIDSVTDNPVIEPKTGKFIHGGNFQARSITTAMDKTRLACQTLGQMLFAQCTELINPHTNVGLPPNLVVDEPNQSWMWKGTDIFIAALQSELGFLAGPTSHVQFAEQGNQAINSLALISARYTMSALDCVSQMMAAHAVAICQAFDLRVLQIKFLESFELIFRKLTETLFETEYIWPDKERLLHELWRGFVKQTLLGSQVPSWQRFEQAMGSLLQRVMLKSRKTADSMLLIMQWNDACIQSAFDTYQSIRRQHLQQPDTANYLGLSSKALYNFVRHRTGVPFFGEEYSVPAEWHVVEKINPDQPQSHHTMGEMITAVYEAIRSGALTAVMADVLKETTELPTTNGTIVHKTGNTPFSELANQLLVQSKILESVIDKNDLELWHEYPERSLPSAAADAKFAIQAMLFDFQHAIRSPTETVTSSGMDVVQSLVFQALYRFDVAGKLPEIGIASYHDLAIACGMQESDLRRIVRYAITRNIFTEPIPNHVAHNGASKALAANPLLRQVLGMCTEELWPNAVHHVYALMRWSGSQDPSHCGAGIARNTELNFFNNLSMDPDREKRFAHAMSFMGSMPGLNFDPFITGYDWNLLGEATIIDVGGSHGTLANMLAVAYPNLRFIVQDLPGVIRHAKKMKGQHPNVSFMVQDFFHIQTVTADVFLLRWVFHDWPDAYCRRILSNLIPVLKVGARILIIDICLPEPGQGPKYVEELLRTFDLTMWSMNNAKERSEKEWHELIASANSQFKLNRIIAVPGSVMKMIEVEWIAAG